MKAISSLSRIKLAGVIVATALLAGQGSALSQGSKNNQPPAAPAPPAGAPGVMSTSSANVDGFRSAKFGMTEAEVKAAVAKDFKVGADAIREQPNAGERTKALVVKVPDLLPGGGAAEVSYVFGYQSKKLIQVSASWSKATDEKMTPEQLFSNSSVLRSHFMSEGFKPESIATNMPINNGLLMFRGSDAKDRTAILLLQGTFAQGENNQRILTPGSLMLFYIADAKTPDIYRLPPGSF